MFNRIVAGLSGSSPDSIRRTLESVRKHLGLEVAYVSEFIGDRTVMREVDAPGLEHLIKVGDSLALDDVYCRHIVAGRLPELISDTAEHSIAQALPITQAVPIGAHVSVPIRDRDGKALGMFCCLSPHPNASLNQRDLQVMRVFADLAASEIIARRDTQQAEDSVRNAIEQLIEARGFSFVFQPIWDFGKAHPVGFEALCRFKAEPYRSPDVWFQEAFAVDRGTQLEMAVLEDALAAHAELPESVFLSVNASPMTILSEGFAALISRMPAHRIVLEITEHAPVEDYDRLRVALAPLRAAGVRLAIDDAGAGYASLKHIIRLRPDIIKLDMSLTRDVDIDPARRALASALIHFARETGCLIVAEGIESRAELETLKLLGVPLGQGYFLGRPLAMPAALRLFDTPSLPREVIAA